MDQRIELFGIGTIYLVLGGFHTWAERILFSRGAVFDFFLLASLRMGSMNILLTGKGWTFFHTWLATVALTGRYLVGGVRE